MKAENDSCLLRADTTTEKNPSGGSRPIDTPTTQAFHQLRLHTEGLALELAVRLRVLLKSLAAACPGQGPVDENRRRGAIAYNNLRRDLDAFLNAQADSELARSHYYPFIRNFIQQTLPFELNGCVDDSQCRIEKVDVVISLLTEAFFEEDAFTEELTASCSG